jgi:hypothetical protein
MPDYIPGITIIYAELFEIIPFGKYKDHTFEFILNTDPGYLIWLNNNVSDVIISKKMLKNASNNINKKLMLLRKQLKNKKLKSNYI